MGDLSPDGHKMRRRVAAWIKHFYEQKRVKNGWNRQTFAKHSGIAKSTISDAINGREDIGLGVNVLINLRRNLHADLNDIVDHDPPLAETLATPTEASPATVTRGRRTKGNG